MGSMLPYLSQHHGSVMGNGCATLCHVVCVCVNNYCTTQPAELGYHIWLVVWNFF
jgi:hypothetical protein